MVEDYKRALCQMCPFEADCRKLREEFQCDQCEEALVCGAQGLLGRKHCEQRKARWRTLPCKCLLVGSRLRERTIDPAELFIWAEEGGPEYGFYRCPRCLEPTLAFGRQHNHRLPHERSGTTASIGLAYFASCDTCGVDDVHKT